MALELEIIIFFVSIFFTFKWLIDWYSAINNVWPNFRNKSGRKLLGFIPLICFMIIIFILLKFASFDVVNDFFYILFYVFLGFTWIYFTIKAVNRYFDLSWRDDALELDNKASLYAIVGGIIGLTFIYSGANVGDGPGWWCVILAGSLGLITWFILTIILNKLTNIFEIITVERNVSTGIRVGFYLLASGLILGRAVAGDWTSFYDTILEFGVFWPVLLLTIFAFFIEKFYIMIEYKEQINKNNNFISLVWGLIYFLFALIAIYLLPPLNENPMYDLAVFLEVIS